MKEYINKVNVKILFSIMLNLTICLVMIFILGLNYEMADDSGYALFIADGCYDFGFINYFYLAFVGFIQNIIYPFNAYVFVFLLLSVLAFTTLTVIFIEKFNYIIATLLTLFINSFFAINHYATISFTRMSALLTVIGFLCIIHYVNRPKWRFGTITGVVFVIIGSMIRFEIFEVSVVMACVFVLAKSIVDYFCLSKTQRSLKQWLLLLFEKKRIIVTLVALIICFSFNFAANIMIKNDKGLSHYWEYTAARSSVWDYAIPDYEVCKSEYDAIGIDSNDIQMLRAGYFDSNGGMSLSKLEDIHRIQKNYNKENISYYGTIKNMILLEIGNIRAIGDKGIASLSFIIICAFFLVLMKKKNYFIPLLLIFPIFIFYSYLWLLARAPFRTVYILWFSTVVYICYSFSINECRDYIRYLISKKKKVVYTLAIFTTFVISLGGFYLTNIANDCIKSFNINENQMSLKKFIEQNKDYKFEISHLISLPSKSKDIFHVCKTNIKKNYQGFSCTYGELPYTKKQIEDFGTDNLYSYLLEDGVFFVDNDTNPHIDMITKHLNKYYKNDNDIIFHKEKNIGDYSVYKFIQK